MAISVLVVDNDDITRDVLIRLIGFRLPNLILHATAAFANAVELCTTWKVDIVITTTSMPPDSSDSMLDSIRAIPHDPVKIIIMSSCSESEHHEERYAARNTYLIPKPIDIGTLIVLIQERIADIEAERVSNAEGTRGNE